jgi:hypothetical protein
LFVTDTANSIPLFSGWRNTIGKLAAYDVIFTANVLRVTESTIYLRINNSEGLLMVLRNPLSKGTENHKVHLFQYKSQFNAVFNVNPGNQVPPKSFTL